jgi:hypothetical protein
MLVDHDDHETYLKRFAGRCSEGLPCFCSRRVRLFAGNWDLAGDVRAAALDCVVVSLYFKNNSPIVVCRRAVGMRLTRISIRARKPCA